MRERFQGGRSRGEGWFLSLSASRQGASLSERPGLFPPGQGQKVLTVPGGPPSGQVGPVAWWEGRWESERARRESASLRRVGRGRLGAAIGIWCRRGGTPRG